MVAVCLDLFTQKLTYDHYSIKEIFCFPLQAVSDFMQELDMFIPFAKAGQDGTLNIVRTAFVDVANLSLKNFHVHMSKVW